MIALQIQHPMTVIVTTWPDRQWSNGPQRAQRNLFPGDELLLKENLDSGGWILHQGDLFQLDQRNLALLHTFTH